MLSNNLYLEYLKGNFMKKRDEPIDENDLAAKVKRDLEKAFNRGERYLPEEGDMGKLGEGRFDYSDMPPKIEGGIAVLNSTQEVVINWKWLEGLMSKCLSLQRDYHNYQDRITSYNAILLNQDITEELKIALKKEVEIEQRKKKLILLEVFKYVNPEIPVNEKEIN